MKLIPVCTRAFCDLGCMSWFPLRLDNSQSPGKIKFLGLACWHGLGMLEGRPWNTAATPRPSAWPGNTSALSWTWSREHMICSFVFSNQSCFVPLYVNSYRITQISSGVKGGTNKQTNTSVNIRHLIQLNIIFKIKKFSPPRWTEARGCSVPTADESGTPAPQIWHFSLPAGHFILSAIWKMGPRAFTLNSYSLLGYSWQDANWSNILCGCGKRE